MLIGDAPQTDRERALAQRVDLLRVNCDLIKRVRADERETLIRQVEAEIHHAADNGHRLDWRCQGVAPGEVVPAVRVDHIRAAIRGAL